MKVFPPLALTFFSREVCLFIFFYKALVFIYVKKMGNFLCIFETVFSK